MLSLTILMSTSKEFNSLFFSSSNVDPINQYYLAKNEASLHSNYFKVLHPNKYFQIYSREVWPKNDQISKKDRKTACKNS